MKRKPIDRQTLKNWRLAMFDLTQDQVQASTGLSKPTIRTAIKHGVATQDTINRLTVFFNQTKAA